MDSNNFSLPSDCVEEVTKTTQSPSSSPSDPDLCPIEEYMGSTFHIPFTGYCWKVELFDGGVISADTSDSNCSKTYEDYVPSITVSNFDYGEGSKAYFTSFGANGFSGQIVFKEDYNLFFEDPFTGFALEPYSVGGGMFDLGFKHPNCIYGPPYPCLPGDIKDKTIYVPVMNLCLKIEMFAGGSLTADTTDATCSNPVHNGQIVASDFDYIRGNRVYFKKSGGWSGVFVIQSDYTRYNLMVFDQIDLQSKEFYIRLRYPSCSLEP